MLRSEFKHDADIKDDLKYSLGTFNIAACKIVKKRKKNTETVILSHSKYNMQIQQLRPSYIVK